MNYIKDLVSVIIPTYRRSDMLVRAIESVLNQTYKNIEVIVVNDNIKGDEFSLELYEKIEAIKDSRLKLIEQEEHYNAAAARNTGIREAKGEYISFLDDDDYWTKEKVELQVDMLKSLDYSYGGVSCLNIRIKDKKLFSATLPYSTKNLMVRILSRRLGIGTGSVLLRRKALDDTGYFDISLKRYDEIQLFAYFADKYKIKLIKKYLYVIDISDGQNRPNAQQLESIKQDYYHSVKSLIEKLSINEQKKIYLTHNSETIYAYLKERQYKKVFMQFLEMLKTPVTILYVLKMFYYRYMSRIFKNYLIKKYNGEKWNG